MKKLILLLLMMIVPALSVQAQLTAPFDSKDGIAAAATKAKENLSNPTLTFIATLNTEFDAPVVGKINVDFKIEDGTAHVWIYAFVDSGDPSKTATIAVGKIIGSFQAFPVDLKDLVPFELPLSLTTPISDKHLDSKMMSDIYKAKADFMAAYNEELKKPEVKVMVGRFINTKIPILPANKEFWGIIMMGANPDKVCGLDIDTKEISCGTASADDNTEINQAEVSIYPNPTSSNVNINFQNPEAAQYNLFVYDVNGILVLENETNDNSFYLNVSSLSKGSYYIQIRSQNNMQTGSFVVE